MQLARSVFYDDHEYEISQVAPKAAAVFIISLDTSAAPVLSLIKLVNIIVLYALKGNISLQLAFTLPVRGDCKVSYRSL